MTKRITTFCGFSGAIVVALGAMGAHFLKNKVDLGIITLNDLHAFETGVKFQMYHTIALLVVALLSKYRNRAQLEKVGYCFMAGIVLFSGSLYILSTARLTGLGSTNLLGPITPIGGLFFIAGWVLLGISGLKQKSSAEQ